MTRREYEALTPDQQARMGELLLTSPEQGPAMQAKLIARVKAEIGERK
jgi:hypothetical protein